MSVDQGKRTKMRTSDKFLMGGVVVGLVLTGISIYVGLANSSRLRRLSATLDMISFSIDLEELKKLELANNLVELA